MAEIFKNRKNILAQDKSKSKQLILDAINFAVETNSPYNAVVSQVKLQDSFTLNIAGMCVDLLNYDKIVIVGGGKGGPLMAEAIEKVLGSMITEGRINVPIGTSSPKIKIIMQQEATHPVPGVEGEKGTRAQTDLLMRTDSPRTLVIALISGGASSLMPLPAEGITMQDKIEMGKVLLEMGADINDVNTVRKHISSIKGGQIRRYAIYSRIITLAISDVMGSDISSIASGMTVEDPTTFKDAYSILAQRNALESTPPNILKRLEEGMKGKVVDTPKPGDPRFFNSNYFLLADNASVCASGVNYIKQNYPNFEVVYNTKPVEGEASVVAAKIVSDIINTNKHASLVANFKPRVYVWGGETTVTVKNKNGIGGRNTEQALAALIALGKSREEISNRMTLAFFATDGTDRVNGTSGAIINKDIYSKALVSGIDLEGALRKNNSNPTLSALGAILRTDNTGGNYADIGFAVIA